MSESTRKMCPRCGKHRGCYSHVESMGIVLVCSICHYSTEICSTYDLATVAWNVTQEKETPNEDSNEKG